MRVIGIGLATTLVVTDHAVERQIKALRNVGLEVLEIVKRKDVNELWDACENLNQACESCHLEYWYPGERALLKKLDHRLEELYGIHPDRTRQLGMEVR